MCFGLFQSAPTQFLFHSFFQIPPPPPPETEDLDIDFISLELSKMMYMTEVLNICTRITDELHCGCETVTVK